MKTPQKLGEALGSFKKYWKKPPKGRYMTYKEITSLSVGAKERISAREAALN